MTVQEALREISLVPITDIEALAYMEAHEVLGLPYPSTEKQRQEVIRALRDKGEQPS